MSEFNTRSISKTYFYVQCVKLYHSKEKKPKTKHKKIANKQPIQALYKGYAFSSHFRCKTYTFFLLKIKALDFGELIFINSPM